MNSQPAPVKHATVESAREDGNYETLRDVLDAALLQAARGKGAQRQNVGADTPFEDQRMQQIARLQGTPDGLVYQVMKKVTEGLILPTLDRQVAELLGAINYIGGIVVYLQQAAALDKLTGRDDREVEGSVFNDASIFQEYATRHQINSDLPIAAENTRTTLGPTES